MLARRLPVLSTVVDRTRVGSPGVAAAISASGRRGYGWSVASLDLAHALDPHSSSLRPLPADVAELLVSLPAPARLAAHLRAVHDVAWQLIEQLEASLPALAFDRDAVLYGAATHDIGKIEHPDE